MEQLTARSTATAFARCLFNTNATDDTRRLKTIRHRYFARGLKNCLLDCKRTKNEHTRHTEFRIIPMLNNLASGPLPESERLDIAADQAIAACGGDLRSTVRALILANEFLEYELCEMFKAVTNTRARGKLPDDRADWFE